MVPKHCCDVKVRKHNHSLIMSYYKIRPPLEHYSFLASSK